MAAKLQYKIDKNKSNCTKWKIFDLRTAQNGKFLGSKLHKMENFWLAKCTKWKICNAQLLCSILLKIRTAPSLFFRHYSLLLAFSTFHHGDVIDAVALFVDNEQAALLA